MRFNRWPVPRFVHRALPRIAWLLSLFSVSACSLRTGEEVAPPRIIVNPAKEGCLAQVDKVLDRYFAGTIGASELDAFWNCLEKALGMFAQNTQGKNHALGDPGRSEGYYTPRELGSFLSRYFLKGKVINEDLLTEIMALKVGLFGGAADQLTGAEILRVQELLRVIHREALALRPFMPITAKHFKDQGYSTDRFEQALKSFEESMKRIGAAVADAPGSYSFDRMAALLDALKVFLYGSATATDKTWIETARNWTSALRPAKAILIAPPEDTILPADWRSIYDLAPRYYGLYMKVSFYLQARNFDYYTAGTGLNRVDSLIREIHELFTRVLENRDVKYITSDEIHKLLAALARNGVWPDGLLLETADKFANVLFNRFFASPQLLAEAGYQVSRGNFDHVRNVFLFGTEGLRALEAIYRDRFGDEFKQHLIPREDFKNLPVDELLQRTAHRNSVSRQAILSLQDSATSVRTTFPVGAHMVEIPADGVPTALSYQHLAIVHLFRTMNRVIFDGYAGREKPVLDESQIQAFFNDFFPFLQDLGLATPALRDSLAQRLLEASLFLYSSDGLRNLTMTEALEFETLITSTLTKAGQLHSEITRRCSADGEQSVIYSDGRNSDIKPNCYRREFVAMQADTWSYLPGLANAVRALSPDDQAGVFDILESFLRAKKNRDSVFTINDTQAFVLLPYYVEMLFSRFDTNHDGYLENGEAEAAYPIFEPFLAEKTPGMSEVRRKVIYYYLLAYEKLPTNWSALFIFWHQYFGNRSFRKDRFGVINIFQAIQNSQTVRHR